MILICDTGSTSSDWALIPENQIVQHHKLDGFNPVFHSHERFVSILHQLSKNTGEQNIVEIHYYGTGIISLEIKERIQRTLHKVFPEAQISVSSDLLGAVYVTCGWEKGIVSILGTGSNACMYDGHKIVSYTPSLGYLLGDEGSGCDIGKTLCRDYYYNRMPQEIVKSITEKLPPSRSDFLNILRREPAVNQYLASFATVAVQHSNHPYIASLVRKRMRKFFEYHVAPYPITLLLHAVGSIAYGFKEIFNTIATDFGFQVGNIERKPIEGLVKYHINKNQNG